MSKCKGYSPYSDAAISFVARNPGCSKFALAAHLRYGRVHPSRLYRLVNYQIGAGSIVAMQKVRYGRYYLYTPEDYLKTLSQDEVTYLALSEASKTDPVAQKALEDLNKETL